MILFMNRIIVLLFSLFSLISSSAESVMQLDPEHQKWLSEIDKIKFYQSNNEQVDINSILKLADSSFRPLQSFVNDDPNAIYWLKFKLEQKNNITEKWVLEILDSRHYAVELYTINHDGSYTVQASGIRQPFSDREYLHKNFVFDLRLQEKYPSEFYIKFIPHTIGSFMFKISSNRSFASYGFNEYYALGAFYGILLIIFIFNMIFFFSLKEKVYFCYAFYILIWAWSSMIDDGTGYQYIWSNHYIITDIGIRASKLFLLVFFLLYVHYFFSDQKPNLFSLPFFWLSIGFYVMIFVLSQILNIYPFIEFTFFILPFVIVEVHSIKYYKGGYKPARFFILGNFFVITGFVIRAIMDLNLFSLPDPIGILLNYSRNIGVLFDIGMLFLALGDRFKFLKLQKELAQQKVIEQLRENEILNQKVNRELEEKVQERTKALSEKSEELNELNKKLEEQAAEINRWNALLDKDNFLLKQKANKELEARLKAEEPTFEEFLKVYPNDLACERYIQETKWRNGYACKKCGNEKFSKGNKLFARRCTKCGYNESVTAFTIFHKCKFPITKAFYIATKVNSKGDNLNCAELARELELRYSTVWDFKNRIMVRISGSEKNIDFMILKNIK